MSLQRQKCAAWRAPDPGLLASPCSRLNSSPLFILSSQFLAPLHLSLYQFFPSFFLPAPFSESFCFSFLSFRFYSSARAFFNFRFWFSLLLLFVPVIGFQPLSYCLQGFLVLFFFIFLSSYLLIFFFSSSLLLSSSSSSPSFSPRPGLFSFSFSIRAFAPLSRGCKAARPTCPAQGSLRTPRATGLIATVNACTAALATEKLEIFWAAASSRAAPSWGRGRSIGWVPWRRRRRGGGAMAAAGCCRPRLAAVGAARRPWAVALLGSCAADERG